MDAKTRAVTSIEHARRELDRALSELDQMPDLDPSRALPVNYNVGRNLRTLGTCGCDRRGNLRI
jgi:hypothetical protein